MARFNRVNFLYQKAGEAHEQGQRRQYKMLLWRAGQLETTGVEPTEEEALIEFVKDEALIAKLLKKIS